MKSGKKKVGRKDNINSNKECFQEKEQNILHNKDNNCFKNTLKLGISMNLKI